MKAISLFSGAGIGEYYLKKDLGINIIAANEINDKRASLYSFFYPDTKMYVGDITQKKIKESLFNDIKDVDLIIATPPCQGVSSLGKNKTSKSFIKDKRNFLIFDVFEFIDKYKPKFVIIENTERFSKMYFPFKNTLEKLDKILLFKYGNEYNLINKTLNCEDYGVAQSRPRSIYVLYKKDSSFSLPKKEKKICLKEAIGYLPSLDPGDRSNIKWHYAKPHKKEIVECLRRTPEGQSALSNRRYFPKNSNGEKISGFHNTYKRMKWSKPCPTRTTYMGSPSSHNNIHPGRKLDKNKYSDPRVLTLLETFIVSSLPKNMTFPSWATDNLIRTVIGEGVPPLFFRKIVQGLSNERK